MTSRLELSQTIGKGAQVHLKDPPYCLQRLADRAGSNQERTQVSREAASNPI